VVALTLLCAACATTPAPIPGEATAAAEDPGGSAPPSSTLPAWRDSDSDFEELPEAELPPPKADFTGGYEVVQVLYVTDRKSTGASHPAKRFGTGRGTVRYGRCVVSISDWQRPDRVETPAWWRLKFGKRPDQRVVLLALVQIQGPLFFDSLRQSTRDVLVFVHDFGVTFEDAVRQTAQLAHDVGFPGIPISYSWPSAGSPTPAGFTQDERNVAATVQHLRSFLQHLQRISRGRQVHLVAQGMGGRALSGALAELAKQPAGSRFGKVVLTAPSINTEIFRRDIAPVLPNMAGRVTIYAAISEHGTMSARPDAADRPAGGTGMDPIVYPGIDTIDISSLGASLVGCPRCAPPEALIRDLTALLNRGSAPGERSLLRRELRTGAYWILSHQESAPPT
jgi:esterase/lipase superfamily enzyme